MRTFFVILAFVLVVGGGYFGWRYQTSPVMVIPVEEVAPGQYVDDPAIRSSHYGELGGYRLKLEQKDRTHFNFVFVSDKGEMVAFQDIDLALFVPELPRWLYGDEGMAAIYYAEREWNRQQVGFIPTSAYVELKGKDNHFSSLELAKNCLNAGLWEVQFFMNEGGEKQLCYHGWFTLPIGYYKALFEELNPDTSYWSQWYRLEHWWDPAGTVVDFNKLRTVLSEKRVSTLSTSEEPILALGEQARKLKTVMGEPITTWEEYPDSEVTFATFEPPGRYNKKRPWGHEFGRIVQLERVWHRKVECPSCNTPLDELELLFDRGRTRLVFGGIDLEQLPVLSPDHYTEGRQLPMGIGVPPFYESYETLTQNPPENLSSHSLLVDEENRWLNHHAIAIDGTIVFRDQSNPSYLHVYLLSYERHALIAHYIIDLKS